MSRRFAFQIVCTVTLVCALGVSCDDEKISKFEGSKSIHDAQEWYGMQAQTAYDRFSPGQSLTPEWEKAWEHTTKTGLKLIIVPSSEIELSNSELGLLRGFIFSSKNGKIAGGKIVEFYGDPDFLANNSRDLFIQYNSINIERFAGSIVTYNLEYKFLRGRVFEEGKKMPAVSGIMNESDRTVAKNNPRISNTYRTQSETVCYDWYLVTYWSDGTEKWQYLWTSCSDGSSGSGSGGSGVPTIQSVNDFTKDGFPPNPYDGQTHVVHYPSGNTVEFTYNSAFGSWMLPEVTIVEEETTFSIESITQTPQNFNGLLTFGAIALAEPTIAGEIVWVGYAVVVGVIYVSTLSNDVIEGSETREHCITLYEYCQTNKPHLPCYDCFRYCSAQGYWDFPNCPDVMQGY